MTRIFPWQQKSWQQLQQRREQSRLPHALLLSGPGGMGKRQFARTLAESLVCTQNDAQGFACGECDSCQLMQAGTHPDFHCLEPDEPGKAIKVDSIRALINHIVSLKSHVQSGYKVAIIQPADAMNRASANSLLKTLEEPPSDTVLLLVTDRPSSLPATVRSRCQDIRLQPPGTKMAREWLNDEIKDAERCETLLQMSGSQAPLKALSFAHQELDTIYTRMYSTWLDLATQQADPVKVTEQWLKLDQDLPIVWIYQWVTDMIRLKIQPGILTEKQGTSRVPALLERIGLRKLYNLLDEVTEARKVVHTQVNSAMLLERILIYWSNLPVKNQ